MDMREFRKPKFLKVEDCREPRQRRIAGVVMGRYQKPDLIFEDGDRLGLSATNIGILSDNYGFQSEAWAGHLVEVYVGKGAFEGGDVDMVLLRPLSKASPGEAAEPVKKAPAKPRDDMDDEIPY